jgi:hypothetical protein
VDTWLASLWLKIHWRWAQVGDLFTLSLRSEVGDLSTCTDFFNFFLKLFFYFTIQIAQSRAQKTFHTKNAASSRNCKIDKTRIILLARQQAGENPALVNTLYGPRSGVEPARLQCKLP